MTEIIHPTASTQFYPALPRKYIPRLGYYSLDQIKNKFPLKYHPAKYQLSVAPHPKLHLPDINYIPLDEAVSELALKWRLLSSSRVAADEKTLAPNLGPEMLPFIAFAPTTEVLFKNTIVPAVKRHALESSKRQLAVDYVSYLFPFWSKKELGDDVDIVEGELSKLIQEGGTLPNDVGAVYLDYPPNQVSKQNAYSFEQLVKFINMHPSVLFIVDEANLYFSGVSDSANDLMFTTQYKEPAKERLTAENNLVIVTNSTTKAIGSSGCAVAVGTNPAMDLLNRTIASKLPIVLGFDKDSFKSSRQVLELERIDKGTEYFSSNAYEFRQTIVQNREKLRTYLHGLFGNTSTSPDLIVSGARIILDATAFGFQNAGELCKALFRNYSIATKPANVYASPKKAFEFGKYVHMTIPWNDEIMSAVSNAFQQLKNQQRQAN
ncbi:hypothetical protein HYW54_02705 [Candidatus Gottesmanbacteria bacterium]|nr:hypothetical protein [Candidatus Gottesmanbacteria bacterium]